MSAGRIWGPRCGGETSNLIATSFTSLDRNIWRLSIKTSTKSRLYSVYIIQVLLQSCATWATTETLLMKMDAFDQWCIRRILRILYSRHVTNADVRSVTGQELVSRTVSKKKLMFSDMSRGAATHEDQPSCSQVRNQFTPEAQEEIQGPPTNNMDMLSGKELASLNFSLSVAWQRAQD